MPLLVCSLGIAKEVSVFGAGNMDSSTPYGLTKAEQASYKNTQKINDLNLKINTIETKTDDIAQQFEGIKSVFDSDSKNLNATKNDLQNLLSTSEELTGRISENEKAISTLNLKLDNFIELQKKNNDLLEESNKKLSEIVNKINKEYVSQKQFDELVSFVNGKKNSSKKTVETPKNDSSNNFGFKTNEALYDYAVGLHKKLYLTKSMPMFKKLINDNHQKAASSYYLADIYHYKKKYKDAIHYYKQSMMLNDQAKYIPELLLNSADSFEQLNDKENAKNFYTTLIEAYSETKEAKEAAKRLEKLK